MDSLTQDIEEIPGVDYSFVPRNTTSEYANIVNSTRYSTPPVDLEWRNLTVSVPVKRNRSQMKVVLHPMSGFVRSGQMLAIMGPSGAGKTSLLNLLAGRVVDNKAVIADGTVYVNGLPREHASFRHYAAYVLQHDYMFSELTVREQIGYAASLRLPNSMSQEAKKGRVERLIRELGLEKVKDSRIGGKLVRGISGGERKRVSIATELVTDPALLFVDEPTTGLDAFAALKVMQSLRVIASSGRTVVTTVHQPRSSIFQLFDQLLLLSEGRVMYFGNATDAVAYFTRLSFRAPVDYNPSDYFLDILSVNPRSAEMESKTRKRIEYFAMKYAALCGECCEADIEVEEYECSSDCRNEEAKSSSNQQVSDVKKNVPNRSYRNSWFTEFYLLFTRTVKVYSRERKAKRTRLWKTIFLAVLLGLTWIHKGRLEGFAARKALAGILFFVCMNVTLGGVFSCLFQYRIDRNVLMRDRAASMYRTSTFYLCRNICDMLTTLLFNSMSCTILYWTVGLRSNAASFFRFLLAIFLMSVHAESLALTLSILLDSVENGMSQIRIFINLCILFGGFFIEQAALPRWLGWCRFFSLVYYGFGALTQIEFPSDSADSNDMLVRNQLGLPDIPYWMNIGALAGSTIVVKIIGYLVLEYLRAPLFLKV